MLAYSSGQVRALINSVVRIGCHRVDFRGHEHLQTENQWKKEKPLKPLARHAIQMTAD